MSNKRKITNKRIKYDHLSTDIDVHLYELKDDLESKFNSYLFGVLNTKINSQIYQELRSLGD